MMNENLSNGQEELEMALNKHLQNIEHELIGHLGTSFIENVFTCGAKIIGKRLGSYQNALVINEGIFNSFTRYKSFRQIITHQMYFPTFFLTF